jgi:stage II sporulation protein GA (sporulation sigma-E factor processing peptidase)
MKRNRIRILLASVISGFYSLIILFPGISEGIVSATKLFFSLILLRVAFGKVSRKQKLRLFLVFFCVNFAFAGLMLAVWLFLSPDGMYYNSSIVYFDIDTVTLLLLTLICYVVLFAAHRFISSRIPPDTVYECKIYAHGKSFLCRCFLDTGNSLTDCYTGSRVIIVNKEIFREVLGENIFDSEMKIRLIPLSTVSHKGVLYAFTCERVEITGLTKSGVAESITVALTDEKIRGGHFDGILPWDIFEITTDEREKSYAFTD